MIKLESICSSNSGRIACVNTGSKCASSLFNCLKKERSLAHISARPTPSLGVYVWWWYRASSSCYSQHLSERALQWNVTQPGSPQSTLDCCRDEAELTSTRSGACKSQFRVVAVSVKPAASGSSLLSFPSNPVPAFIMTVLRRRQSGSWKFSCVNQSLSGHLFTLCFQTGSSYSAQLDLASTEAHLLDLPRARPQTCILVTVLWSSDTELSYLGHGKQWLTLWVKRQRSLTPPYRGEFYKY